MKKSTPETSVCRCSLKKVILIFFSKFAGRLLCWIFFFNELGGWRHVTLLREKLQFRSFPANFGNLSECFWNSFLCENSLRSVPLQQILFKVVHEKTTARSIGVGLVSSLLTLRRNCPLWYCLKLGIVAKFHFK